MALLPTAIASIDSKIEITCRKIWNLPKGFPKTSLHASQDELGLNLPTRLWEDYPSAAIISWTEILNDNGALGATAQTSLFQVAAKFKQ